MPQVIPNFQQNPIYISGSIDSILGELRSSLYDLEIRKDRGIISSFGYEGVVKYHQGKVSALKSLKLFLEKHKKLGTKGP